MNANEWLNYYQRNSRNRIEPDWHLPCPLERLTKQAIARSLSHFQLGESGGGSFLLSCATREAPDNAAYHEALKLFVAEEQEHARLLACLVRRFGRDTIQRHWTQSLFRMVRRVLGLNFELQVLVIAELVGTAYYRLLRARSRDPVLEQVCDQILRDEASHVDFHAEWLQASQLSWLPLECAVWKARFQILFILAAAVAWFDHRNCLANLGTNRDEFFREARQQCIHFLQRLARHDFNEAAATGEPVPQQVVSQ